VKGDMTRLKSNPILEPIQDHPWESECVFNPAMVCIDNKIHIFYRAIGEDRISRIGYASTNNGYQIEERLPYPVFKPINSYEKYGCEDPRLTPFDGWCAMTYTAYGDIYQIGITTISFENILNKKWEWGERLYPFPNIKNKNAVIFPRRIQEKYVMLHRLEPNIHIAYSYDLKTWSNSNLVMKTRPEKWDSLKIGAAGPPIELGQGWLLIYHGVDYERVYRLGVAILDKQDPKKILYRAQEPIIEPLEEYERRGFVPNVVFSCGSVLRDNKLIMSYGAADKVIGIASFDIDAITPYR
jgi:predicted GH43/DUF377 family glycosyl hydrolase